MSLISMERNGERLFGGPPVRFMCARSMYRDCIPARKAREPLPIAPGWVAHV